MMSQQVFATSIGYDPNFDDDPCEQCRGGLHLCHMCGTDVDHGEFSCSHCMRELGTMAGW